LEIPHHRPAQRWPAQLCIGPAAVLGDSRVASRRQGRINTRSSPIVIKDVVSEPWRNISHKHPHRTDTSQKPVSGQLRVGRPQIHNQWWLSGGLPFLTTNS